MEMSDVEILYMVWGAMERRLMDVLFSADAIARTRSFRPVPETLGHPGAKSTAESKYVLGCIASLVVESVAGEYLVSAATIVSDGQVIRPFFTVMSINKFNRSESIKCRIWRNSSKAGDSWFSFLDGRMINKEVSPFTPDPL